MGVLERQRLAGDPPLPSTVRAGAEQRYENPGPRREGSFSFPPGNTPERIPAVQTEKGPRLLGGQQLEIPAFSEGSRCPAKRDG